MKIQYVDNYDEELLEIDSPYMPRVGETVFCGSSDERIVTKVYWNADACIGIVELTLADEMLMDRSTESDNVFGKINQLQANITETRRAQAELRKKNRGLRDQVSSMRGSMNRQAQKERKT